MAEGSTRTKRNLPTLALPQNWEMEASVLGAVLLEAAIPKGLTARLLHNPRHQDLLKLMEGLRSDGRGLDLATVVGAVFEAHATFGPQGGAWVAGLPGKVPSLEAVPSWIRELKRLAHHRDMVVWSGTIQACVQAGDFEEAARLQKAPPKEPEEAVERVEPNRQIPEESPDLEVRRELRLALKRKASERLQADIVLRQDPRWKGRLWFDAFRQIQMLGDRRHADQDDQAIAMWLERAYRVRLSGAALSPIISAIAADNQRDPLLEYLRSIHWDGTPRISHWLTLGMGVPDSALTQTIARRWLIQAVARALRPGCKADVVLMLVGPQGARKSSGLRTLVGPEFFSDSPILMGDKDGIAQTHAAWVHELAELIGMKKREVEEIKAHISAQEDTYRPSYGRKSITQKRRCVFGATTNEDTPLVDPTGARRFWPVTVESVDTHWIGKFRDQLWAEAVAAFEAGEIWHLSQEEEAEINTRRQDYQREEPWEDRLTRWLEDPEVFNVYWTTGNRHGRRPVTTAAILEQCLKIPAAQQMPAHSQTVGRLLQHAGLIRTKVRSGTRTSWAYVPPDGKGGDD